MGAELWRICGVALLCAAVGMLLRSLGSNLAFPARALGGLLILSLILPSLRSTVEVVRTLFEVGGVERYAVVMLRALGVAMLGRICAEVCRDCGESGTASGVELAGKLAILSLCLPLIEEILEMATALLA